MSTSDKSGNYGRGLRFFRWQQGRAAGGYSIYPLIYTALSANVGVDVFLLWYKPGSSIGPHRDPLNSFPKSRHFRVNTTLLHLGKGGEFHSESVILKLGPFVLFRPDINEHYVTEVKGCRLLLSMGLRIP